jgi:hypothetical protein
MRTVVGVVGGLLLAAGLLGFAFHGLLYFDGYYQYQAESRARISRMFAYIRRDAKRDKAEVAEMVRSDLIRGTIPAGIPLALGIAIVLISRRLGQPASRRQAEAKGNIANSPAEAVVRRSGGLLFMSEATARGVGTVGIWVAAAVILAFGVFWQNWNGDTALFMMFIFVVVVCGAASISTAAVWGWGRDKRVSSEQLEAQPLSAKQDPAPDRPRESRFRAP